MIAKIYEYGDYYIHCLYLLFNLIAVLFTPTIYTISIFSLYVIIITWNILDGCNISVLTKILVTCLYTADVCNIVYIYTLYMVEAKQV